MSKTPSNAGYAENAEALVRQYEALSFAAVHRDVLHLIPSAPSRVLDVGAGTGRDAAALAALGHKVVAVEPTRELSDHGRRLHADVQIEWIDDGLPDLRTLFKTPRRFDLILLTAVWMHLDPLERRLAMGILADLLAPAGTLVMSLRHGPVPEGRRMFDVRASETVDLARRHGLAVVHESARDDAGRRPGVHWTILGFRRL